MTPVSKTFLFLAYLAVPSIAHAASITYSVTATSFYQIPSNPVQAEAYVTQAFPFSISEPTTLTFSATYTQTPHTCVGPRVDYCQQDLSTFAYTQIGLYFDAAPDLGICNKVTRVPFPCSATLPAGNYDLVMIINDTLFTSAIIGNVALPYSDTMTVTIDGLPAAVPEPSTIWLLLTGSTLTAITVRRRSRASIRPLGKRVGDANYREHSVDVLDKAHDDLTD